MDEWDEIARRLEQNRNEVKWQESVNRTAVALRMAYRAGLDKGKASVRLPNGPTMCELMSGEMP